MSSDAETKEQEPTPPETLVVNKVRFIQGVNALTSLYHDALVTFEDCRAKVGDNHNATRLAYQQLKFIGGLVAHFTDLVTLNDEDLKRLKESKDLN